MFHAQSYETPTIPMERWYTECGGEPVPDEYTVSKKDFVEMWGANTNDELRPGCCTVLGLEPVDGD